METPKISVVIPTFNSQDFVERSLGSVLAQTLPPKEVIVIDDGSQDKTSDVIQGFSKKFAERGIAFKFLKNNHVGPGFTRNAGISAAEGEWIAFLDSDDSWEPQKLEACAEVIQKNDTNTVTHWEQYRKLDGSTSLLKHARYNLTQNLSKQIYQRNQLSTSAMICKRDLLQKVGGFDGKLPVSQDYDLWLRLSPYMKLQVIEEPLGFYFEHEHSITARPYWKRYPPFVKLLIKNRHLGTTATMIYLLARATLSRQWISSLKNSLVGKKRH
jgi:glycosyltransferase involved in cell wall biosynthesis